MAPKKKKGKNKKPRASATAGLDEAISATASEPSNASQGTDEPSGSSPTTSQASQNPNTNGFDDLNATRVSRVHVLATFRTEEVWRKKHKSSVKAIVSARECLMRYILFHSCLRNHALIETTRRSELLKQNAWPFTLFPDSVVQLEQNHIEWFKWIVCIDEAVPNALIQFNWMTLLQREYRSNESTWARFYELHSDLEHKEKSHGYKFNAMPAELLDEMAEIEVHLAIQNRRRQFLQNAIVANKDSAEQMYTKAPAWIDWDLMIQHMIEAAGLSQMGVEGGSEQREGEYESGHVSELEDTEDDEDDFEPY